MPTTIWEFWRDLNTESQRRTTMRKVIVSEYVTLDGIMDMEAPEQWHFPFWNDELAKYAQDLLFASDALLLGRVTYEGFAATWPSVSDEQGFADRMNSLPKYVVSTTLTQVEWNNSRLIKDNVADELTKLKQQPGQNILVYGSADLVHALMQQDLIDEYRLWVHPVVVGRGKHLFKEGVDTKVLKLIETKTFSSGVVALTYQPESKE
jgi:dihydrofolate reductase